jgi:serine/threonine-protein kinase RsbW
VSVVKLTFVAKPAHVRTARQVAVALARRSKIPDDVLDEVRLAVSEACGLLVSLQRQERPDDPVVLVFEDSAGLAVDVRSTAPLEPATGDAALKLLTDAILPSPDTAELPVGAALAVLSELAPRLEVTTSERGVQLVLGWPPVAQG